MENKGKVVSREKPMEIGAVIYPAFLCSGVGLIMLVFDFLRVKCRHEMLESVHSISDVISNVFPEARSIEEEDYQKILRLIGEEHSLYRTDTTRQYSEMIDYCQRRCSNDYLCL